LRLRPEWLNLNKAAGLLGIAPKTLRLAAEAGEIEGGHPLPDGPWIFSQSTLGEPAAQRVVHRARQNPHHPFMTQRNKHLAGWSPVAGNLGRPDLRRDAVEPNQRGATYQQPLSRAAFLLDM
jgi:hypothetical protein